MQEKKTYDLFISHASEDKEDFVAPLAKSLRKLGLDVWYDEFSLTIGDSLSRSIDKGLASSTYGLVVLSPSFLEKDWPEYELRGLISREINGQKVILPVWHEITKEKLLAYSPPLADKYALDTRKHSRQEIALQAVRVARPDIFESLQRRATYEEMKEDAVSETVPLDEIDLGPIRHESLPKGFLLRVKLVQLTLSDVHEETVEEMINNFRRDVYPEDELRIWENIAAAYLEATKAGNLDIEQKKAVFGALLEMTVHEGVPESVRNGSSKKKRKYERLLEIYHDVIPEIPES